MTLFYKEMKSPVGKLKLVASFQSSGRRSLGAGTSGSSKTRYNESRSSAPDPDRG